MEQKRYGAAAAPHGRLIDFMSAPEDKLFSLKPDSADQGVQVELKISGTKHADVLADHMLSSARHFFDKQRKAEATPTLHPRILGRSEPILALFKLLGKLRNSDATALILGENGTGKELVAKSIHEESKRAKKNFVAANCSAFNDNLLESEMFGHKRGAFTGAVIDKQGLFEMAHGGTFFMDEVGDMTPALQVKLLRVLQEGTFTPVGGTEARKVDVRVIAATNRDLSAMVKKGTFREDLFYRLNVVGIRVPALRDRKDDIPLLVDYFLKRLSSRYGSEKRMSDGAMESLLAHNWPGNVRELENEIERLWVLAGEQELIDTVNLRARSAPQPTAAEDLNLAKGLENLEKTMIEKALESADQNLGKAALLLGIQSRVLARKIEQYQISLKR